MASLAVHSLLFLVVIRGRLPELPRRPGVVLLPLPEPDQVRPSPMPYYVPRLEQGAGRRTRVLPPANPAPPDTAPPPAPPVAEPAPAEAPRRLPPPSLRPSLGDGRLWVRPLPLPPRDLARRLARPHEELVDSAVKAIVQAYLDSIANEPGAAQARMPEWVTEVDGKKFGLDGKNIYIAGLKIPAAVLALLPVPSGGNQQVALDHNGQVILDDLRRAAIRSANLAEFKDAIRRLREQKQREKDFERAQREPPDTFGLPALGSEQP